MIAYFDASALAKFFAADEIGHGEALHLWEQADQVVSSSIVRAETRAALAAMVRAGRLAHPQVTAARKALTGRLAELDTIAADDPVCERAGLLAERYSLRGSDAIHLASALMLGTDLTVVAWDARLAAAARDAGLATAGA